ncbi:DODA-type extradiol aromatic ring-opening family dioxygenase [Aeromonas hydrophila]|uniref:DODA-type extradiol aromatic ring-opening family dioxygenase n=1 Tax=Aeromonas hydrophila TaxID=644 RepID=UPI0005A7A567|nr:class III extradiol ring-cleavage dioxygenase [Aeromonas hydrophila]
MSIAPVWFISHGAPDLVLRDQPATHFLKNLRLGDLKGLVVISAHWFTRSELQINVEPNPALMYDFYGFPEPLYHIRWPASSPLWLQEAVSDQLLLAGLPAEPVRRELDHGVWSPLSLMDPASSVPLVQLSIPASFTPRQLWQLGEALQQLRAQGIGILASGAITHNLRALGPENSPVPGWARSFVNWLELTMSEGDRTALEDYRARASGAVESHPHDDHLRPLFVALGAAGQDKPDKLHDSWDGGSLYMGSYRFG